MLENPVKRRALESQVPTNAAPGTVTIRHSSANEDQFEAFASVDIKVRVRALGPRTAAPNKSRESPTGGAVIVKHFDINGNEQFLPQEKLNLQAMYPETKKEPE
jgi:hypothetical protein